MKKHIVRIEADWLRIPLLCLFQPFWFLEYIVTACMPEAWGGHPNKHRLIEWDFYSFHWLVFWAAWDGYFVPDEAS